MVSHPRLNICDTNRMPRRGSARTVSEPSVPETRRLVLSPVSVIELTPAPPGGSHVRYPQLGNLQQRHPRGLRIPAAALSVPRTANRPSGHDGFSGERGRVVGETRGTDDVPVEGRDPQHVPAALPRDRGSLGRERAQLASQLGNRPQELAGQQAVKRRSRARAGGQRHRRVGAHGDGGDGFPVAPQDEMRPAKRRRRPGPGIAAPAPAPAAPAAFAPDAAGDARSRARSRTMRATGS